MKKPTPESLVKKKIAQYIQVKYPKALFWFNKTVGVFDPNKKIFRKNKSKYELVGVSDILGIYKGLFFAIEVKSKTGRPTPEQLNFIKEIEHRGGFACVARDINDVDELFNRMSELCV